AKPDVLLIVPPTMPFRNVIGHRNGRPPHLIGQGVLLLGRKLFEETVNPLSEFPSAFVQLKVIQFETPFVHCDHSPLTTHHSPLPTPPSPPTTHHSPLTTHPSPLPTPPSPLTSCRDFSRTSPAGTAGRSCSCRSPGPPCRSRTRRRRHR